MSKDIDPIKHNKFRRTKDVLFRSLGCVTLLAVSGGAATVGATSAWKDRSEQIAAESVQDRTHEKMGTKEVVEVVSLQDVRPVTGYTIEHKDMVVTRDLEKEVLGLNVLEGNSVSVEVDVDSESQISLNLEKLNEIEATYSPDEGTVTLEVSYEDLTVSSHEVRSSRETNRQTHGPLAKAGGAIDGVVNDEDKKFIQDTQNDLETLAVNLALKYADDNAINIVNDTLPAFEKEIAKVVMYEMDLSEDEVDVIVKWTDTDSFPEIEDEEKHLQKIQELGGTVQSEGDQNKVGLPSTGGRA